MNRQFDLIKIEKCLPKKESAIKKYFSIINMLHSCNVSSDEIFQKLYNGFYRLRLPASEYYQKHFDYLEKNKNNKNIAFSDVILYMSNLTGRVEASFSSKIVATINQDMPVWDNNVLSHLSINIPKGSFHSKIEQSVLIYNDLCNYYDKKLKENNAKDIIKIFNNLFPQYRSITDIKKLDLAIWSLGVKPKTKKIV